MRSRCRRSIISASAPSSRASKSWPTMQPLRVSSSGSSDCGPQTRISPTPSVRRACRSVRATRECFTSPTISTFIFEKSLPLAWRRVSMSSRPWVGCALRPSPALINAVPSPAAAANWATAPSSGWRTTKPRTPIASRFFSVSQAVSPLRVDEVDASKLSTSAPSRWAASWNELRVRVDGSKNSVQTAEPPSTWRLLPTRPTAASRIWPARSSNCNRVSRGRPSRVSRWRRRPSESSCEAVMSRVWGVRKRGWRRRDRTASAR